MQPTAQQAQNCATVSVPNPIPGGAPSTRQACRDNPVLKPLNAELASLNAKLRDTESALKLLQTNVDRARKQLADFDEKLGKSEAADREAINHSQLHSYSAMLFRKDPREVTDGEVKTLEWYLIIVPSIAAAFASTLIAITAVSRIRTEPATITSIPDDAAAYLFGPLLAGIKTETRTTVLDPMSSHSKAPSPASG